MTAAAAAIAQQYEPDDFQAPAALLYQWPSSDHRNARRVAKNASIVIAHLRFVADIRLSVETKSVEEADRDREEQQAQESALSILHSMRFLQAALDGVGVRRLCRDVSRFAPHMQAEVTAVIQEASAHLKEMRALLAFLTDESDDTDLGIELVPPAGVPRPAEDSHPAS